MKTAEGFLRGSRVGEAILFHGIPYARAPIGALRFAAPQPVPPWLGIREARRRRPGAVQPRRIYSPWTNYFNPPKQSFDCLTLRVHAPADVQRAPVLVWVHGGGFVSGVGTAPAHRGDSWVRDGIVHVALNYRLGLDGFVLWEDSIDTGSDNLGLRDQVAALQWVQRNIAAFGGDPHNVTVMGQSSGAVCVAMLMASPLACGLFHRAVICSGAPQGSFDPATGRDRGDLVARLAGREPTKAAMQTLSAHETRVATRAADELFAHHRCPDGAGLPVAFTVTHGTPSLPQPVLRALEDGAASQIPLLIGTNNDEVAGMMAAIGLTDPGNDDILQALIDRFRLSDAGLSMYRLSRDTNSDMVAFCGAASDLLFGLPSLRMAQLHRGSNHVYRFTWQSPSLPRGMGADHSFDIPFIQDDFDSLLACSSVGREVLGADPPTELAREMHGAVVRFIAQGDPGWRQFDRDRGYVRHFGDGPIDPSPGVPSIDAGSSAVLGETRFDLCM